MLRWISIWPGLVIPILFPGQILLTGTFILIVHVCNIFMLVISRNAGGIIK